jgi:putative PIN family toxin of toxin-antitoxin system
MTNVVVDTNVFVSALKSADGASRQIIRLCLAGDIRPIMGSKLFLEFCDVLGRSGLFDGSPATAAERELVFQAFLSVCRWVEVFFLWRPNLPDDSDNHVLELALAGGASALITYNISDFSGELKFPKLQVITPARFLEMLR